MNEATQGTWGITESEMQEFYLDEWYVSAEGIDGMVAIVNGEANAHRVAAAPDLLEVAETVVAYERHLPASVVTAARAAIAKAKGVKFLVRKCSSPVCSTMICPDCGECPNRCGFDEDEASPHDECVTAAKPPKGEA